jgi:hypothetical protein
MNSNKLNLGGFPPIYEIVANIKKKEYQPSTILSIQAILSKKKISTQPENINNDVIKVRDRN